MLIAQIHQVKIDRDSEIRAWVGGVARICFLGDHKVAKTANLWFPNQRYAPFERWWALQDLNLRPTDYESAALTS